MIDGVKLIPLGKVEDERGWFAELRRDSRLPRRLVQTNVSFSHRGVIRGLHYHEQGQDDLFVCLAGTARIVVLDRGSGGGARIDIGEENFVGVYVPGYHAHGFEAITGVLLLPRHRGVRPGASGRVHPAVERPASQAPVEHPEPDPLETRFPRVLITGAGGQLGGALAEAFPWADPRTRLELDVRRPDAASGGLDLILHAAAWTDVDGAEEHARAAREVNVIGTRRIAALGAPVLYYSSDYVFDGHKRQPYLESDEPSPSSVYGRSKLDGEREVLAGWIVRTSWLFGWAGHNFVRTMLRLGRERDEVAVVDDQQGSPTYVGHLAEATRRLVELPDGIYHVAAEGDCTWAEFAEAIFEEAGLDCHVRRISSEQLKQAGFPPPLLPSEARGERRRASPHWREGLRACLARLL